MESNIKRDIRKNGMTLFNHFYNYGDRQNDVEVWLHIIQNRIDIPKVYKSFIKGEKSWKRAK